MYIKTSSGLILKQVGEILLRCPDGTQKHQPLYAEVDPAELNERGMTAQEERNCSQFAAYMAERYEEREAVNE